MPSVAKVIVELALNREFDYRVPDNMADRIGVGMQVRVPFGKRHIRGYVVGLTERSDRKDLKPIEKLVGKKSLVLPEVLELARWMADYYVCPIENAVRTMLPVAVRKRGAKFRELLHVVPTDAGKDKAMREALAVKAPKQAAVLDYLAGEGDMFLSDLARAAQTTPGTIHRMVEKGLVRIGWQARRRDPLDHLNYLPTNPLDLMPEQAEALALVRKSMDTLAPPVVLLYGVTGSGKTEVYLQAIQHGLDEGKGAIVLVPEISLTPQTVERFRSRFGEITAVLHSSLSEGERHDEWHRIRDGKARIVIGARSALFAPVENLGLIVVDEEHEGTYKQEESPRYHARDVAVMRGRMQKCSVVLGTATPSMESMFNAHREKYGLARLTHRVDHRRMPVMRVVDMRVEAEREGRVNVLSRDLLEAMRERLDRTEQIILFLNRRGFATSLICPKCGYVAECGECSISMTYHKKRNRLCCHICGATRAVPPRCPNPECNDPAYRFAGVGTQRVEEVVTKIFPTAHIARMDADTMTARHAYERVLSGFRAGNIDILIGTQMIAKGLHFPNVTLVGVIYADASLHMPDFRAAERTFQLLTQVAGRAGRGDVMGEVIVQTFTPTHPAIQAARRLDYEGFFDQEIEYRRELSYPPISHLACITLSGKREALVSFTAETLARALRKGISEDIVIAGPAPAPLAKAKGLYRFQIVLRAVAASRMNRLLSSVLDGFTWPDEVKFTLDIDAQSMR